jgi:nitrogen fixation NifU-like protein
LDSGYSNKAITYFIHHTNEHIVAYPDAHATYTGSCDDTVEIFLNIRHHKITEASFMAIGCVGVLTAASALIEIIKGKTLIEAKQVNTNDVLRHLGKIPEQKIHCIYLVLHALRQAIDEYEARL